MLIIYAPLKHRSSLSVDHGLWTGMGRATAAIEGVPGQEWMAMSRSSGRS